MHWASWADYIEYIGLTPHVVRQCGTIPSYSNKKDCKRKKKIDTMHEKEQEDYISTKCKPLATATTMVGVRQPVTHRRDGKSMCGRGMPDGVVDLHTDGAPGAQDGAFCVGAESWRTDGKIANGIG